jgi:glycosyltransferase involved in cell wall biosynthesis
VKAQVRELDLGEQVQIPGNIPDLGRLMQAADGLALPSRWEGLPLVLLEGMIRGLPVVGTRIKGINEIITDGVHGWLVAPDDPPAMAKVLARLMDDPAEAVRMGREGRELVADRFSFSRVYRELMEIFSAPSV